MTAEEVEETKRDYTRIREQARDSLDGLALDTTDYSAVELPKEERDRIYQQVYDESSPFKFMNMVTDIPTDLEANRGRWPRTGRSGWTGSAAAPCRW